MSTTKTTPENLTVEESIAWCRAFVKRHPLAYTIPMINIGRPCGWSEEESAHHVQIAFSDANEAVVRAVLDEYDAPAVMDLFTSVHFSGHIDGVPVFFGICYDIAEVVSGLTFERPKATEAGK